MTTQAKPRRSGRLVPHFLFAAGLLCTVGIYVVPALLGHSRWDTAPSSLARAIYPPTLVFCFLCCCGAPFFSSLRPSMRFAAAFAAALAFVLALLAALALSLWLCPAPSYSSAILPNHSMQRMGASRSAYFAFGHPPRLAPTADAER